MASEPTRSEVDAFHHNSDVDVSPRSQHHTIGQRSNQASPGDHTHDGNNSPLIPWSSIDPNTLPVAFPQTKAFKSVTGLTFDPTTTTTIVPIGNTSSYIVGLTDSANSITIVTPGWYELAGTIEWNPGATGLGTALVAGNISINGVSATETTSRDWPQTGNTLHQSFRTQRLLSAGDVIAISAARSSALTAGVVNAASLTIRREF